MYSAIHRWTKYEAGLGLVNSRTAEVVSVEDGMVLFRLEEGRTIELGGNGRRTGTETVQLDLES